MTLGATTTVRLQQRTYSPSVCQELEVAAMHFFASFGWPDNVRIKIQVNLVICNKWFDSISSKG